MIFFNRPFFFIECWIGLAAVVGQVLRSVADGNDYETAKQLDSQIKSIISDCSWWPPDSNRGGNGARKEYSNAKDSRLSKMMDGLFDTNHRPTGKSKSSPSSRRRHVTIRPKDATGEDGNTAATANDQDDPQTTTVATATGVDTPGGPTIFGAENDCLSANNGRPCVCHMIDFLDSVSQRLDEEVGAEDDTTASVESFACSSYKVVPSAFIVSPSPVITPVTVTDETTTVLALVQSSKGMNKNETVTAAAPEWKEVDFDYVVNYQLNKSKDDHFKVHYGLLGSDIKIRCLVNSSGINVFKWDYEKRKLKTNSTITGMDMNNLLILHLESGDSKNYTCMPTTELVENSKTIKNAYTHYVIAIDKPIYELRGSALYKTKGGGRCTYEMINPIRKQLPGFMQTEMCPEGSSRYACNVVVESSKCSEDEITLEVNYVVTLNDKASHLTRIRTSKKCRNALFYQKLLARISNVLVGNLKKTMSVQITSKYSLTDMNFEPDQDRIHVDNFISCSPGFGIREVFCSACPPHHYSPDKSANCLKCSQGFHQPVAGSEKCVKCPSLFASGCYMKDIPIYTYYVTIFICFLVCLTLVVFCACCCREENETTIRIIPRNIRSKFKRSKGLRLLSDQTPDDSKSNFSSLVQQTFKKMIKFNVKSKDETFDNVHEPIGRYTQIQED